MSDYDHIALDTEGPLAILTLDRPDKLNAYTDRMRVEMLDAFDRTDADDDVRAVIVTGRGRAFCAGADLSGGSGTAFGTDAAARPEDHRDGGGQVALRIFRSLKPVIAAINGPAVGVGITMTLPMDVRLAADNARIGFVFTRRGITPEACSSWFLPRLVGPAQAAEWLYTGRVFGADEALAGRLVRSIHPAEEVVDAARRLATEMVEGTAPVSVALSRQLLWRGLTFDAPMASHLADSRAIFERGRSADVGEGVSSFLEKRPAQFPDLVSKDLPDVFAGLD